MLQVPVGLGQFISGINAQHLFTGCPGEDINPEFSVNGAFDNIGQIYLSLLVVCADFFQGLKKKRYLSTVDTGIDLPDFFLLCRGIFFFHDPQKPTFAAAYYSAVICRVIKGCSQECQDRFIMNMFSEHRL